ncbi:protein SRG1-like [Chenopodium quinoa]|uniref:protein SRG1-like n=1 Tax=Chenopodium quinoa TaxID=63459 RepID=UPI000B76C2AF|nr:protein SRG1-like [Chenopodium quinoa]
MEEMLQSKPVQEIALSCNGEIPEQFIHKDGFPPSKVDSVSYMDDFVIDFSLVFLPSSPESDHELGKLRSALSQWGCFQAINHGMTNDFLDKIREVGKQFFALPLEEKQKYSRGIDDWDGYGNDAVVSKQQTLDWMDRLYLTVNPEDQRKLKYWPEKPVAFRYIFNIYSIFPLGKVNDPSRLDLSWVDFV